MNPIVLDRYMHQKEKKKKKIVAYLVKTLRTYSSSDVSIVDGFSSPDISVSLMPRAFNFVVNSASASAETIKFNIELDPFKSREKNKWINRKKTKNEEEKQLFLVSMYGNSCAKMHYERVRTHNADKKVNKLALVVFNLICCLFF